MLLRLAYLAPTKTFTLMRLLPLSDLEKDIEILALRHQLIVLQRQVAKPAFTQTDRIVLAGLLRYLPAETLRRFLVLVRAGTLRLARENSSWGYRRIHGELAALGVKVAASTVWEILNEHGVVPAPERESTTWTRFLHS